jgi:hypothetical protein
MRKDPNTKFQDPEKLQDSNSNVRIWLGRNLLIEHFLEVGCWKLEVRNSLDVGALMLEDKANGTTA